MTTLGDLLTEDDKAAMEALRKERAEYEALPKAERKRLLKEHTDRVARDIEPHRLDLTDDDEDDDEE